MGHVKNTFFREKNKCLLLPDYICEVSVILHVKREKGVVFAA